MPAITDDRRTDVADEVRRGPYPLLTPAAIERAKIRLGTDRLDRLAEKLGFSDMAFWRVRVGKYDIRYSHALRVAEQLDWPVGRVFEGGRDA